MGDQRLADQRCSERPDLVFGSCELHAACLATTAGMDLRLDHPEITAQRIGRINRLVRGIGDAASRHGNAETL